MTSELPDDPEIATPPSLRRVSVLLGIESAALLIACVSILVLTVVHDTTRLWAALVIALFALAGSAFLFYAARGLVRLHAGYRSPAVLVQLLAIPVAIGLVQGGRWPVGVPILVVALIVIHQLFTSQTRDVLDRQY